MVSKGSPQPRYAFKSLGASFGTSMIDIFQEIPQQPPQKNLHEAAVLPHKDILDTVCLHFNYQVKEIILATTSPSNPLLYI